MKYSQKNKVSYNTSRGHETKPYAETNEDTQKSRSCAETNKDTDETKSPCRFPGRYLHIRNGEAFMEENNGSELFMISASFIPHYGLSSKVEGDFSVSFESQAQMGYFLVHGANFRLVLGKFENTEKFRADASWMPLSGEKHSRNQEGL